MRELNGKTALVTGASRGIGSAIARSLANAGAYVLVADKLSCEKTVAEIKSSGGSGREIGCDVGDWKSVKRLFRSIKENEKRLDFAINAAGILLEAKITEMQVEDFDHIVAVNLRGSFLVAKGAVELMKPALGGRIILISSELAYLGREDFSAYCASKAGVVGLTRSLARELAPKIKVNSVAPGPVDTPMLNLENMSQEWIDKELDIPLKRVAKPEEIAGLIRFLCGPDACFFTGQTISPNGGAVMI